MYLKYAELSSHSLSIGRPTDTGIGTLCTKYAPWIWHWMTFWTVFAGSSPATDWTVRAEYPGYYLLLPAMWGYWTCSYHDSGPWGWARQPVRYIWSWVDSLNKAIDLIDLGSPASGNKRSNHYLSCYLIFSWVNWEIRISPHCFCDLKIPRYNGVLN